MSSEGGKGKKGDEDEEEDEASTSTRATDFLTKPQETSKTPSAVQKPKDLPLKHVGPSTTADLHKSKQPVTSSKVKLRTEPPVPKRRETSPKVSSRKEPSPKRVTAEPKSPLAQRRSADMCQRHGGSQESLKDMQIGTTKRDDRRSGKSPVTPTKQTTGDSVRRTPSKSQDPKPRKDSPGTRRKVTLKKEDSPKKRAKDTHSFTSKTKSTDKRQERRCVGEETFGNSTAANVTADVAENQKSIDKSAMKLTLDQHKTPSNTLHINTQLPSQSENMSKGEGETADYRTGTSASFKSLGGQPLSKDKTKDLLKQETLLLKEVLKLQPVSDKSGMKSEALSDSMKFQPQHSKPIVQNKRDNEVPSISNNEKKLAVDEKHASEKASKSTDFEKIHDILTDKINISMKEMLTLKNSSIQEQTKEFPQTSKKEKRTQSEGSNAKDGFFSPKHSLVKNESHRDPKDGRIRNVKNITESDIQELSDETLTLERQLKDEQNNSIKGFPGSRASQSVRETIECRDGATFDSKRLSGKKVSMGFMRAQSITSIEISSRPKINMSDSNFSEVNENPQRKFNTRKGSLDTQESAIPKIIPFHVPVSTERKTGKLQISNDQRLVKGDIARVLKNNEASSLRTDKRSVQACKFISSDNILHVQLNENEKPQSERETMSCGGLQGRKCPIYFGVKSYLHQFYDSAPSKDPYYDYFEDEDDFEYLVDPSKRQKPCCCQGLWFRVGLWGGANLLLIGVIALLVGHLTPPRQTIVAFEDDLEVLDRWAIAFNHRLEMCRLAGLAVFCCGGVVLLTTLLLSTITHARRETSIMRHMAPLVDPFEAVCTAAKIPITEKIRQVQPSLWPEAGVIREGGLVQIP